MLCELQGSFKGSCSFRVPFCFCLRVFSEGSIEVSVKVLGLGALKGRLKV